MSQIIQSYFRAARLGSLQPFRLAIRPTIGINALSPKRPFSITLPSTQGRLGRSPAFERRFRSTQAPRTPLHSQRRGFRSTGQQRSSGQSQSSEVKEPQSLSARLRKLSREYGWVAVGVYFGLSVLDFPFCFLFVRVVGTEKIAIVEHWVVDHVSAVIPEGVKTAWHSVTHGLRRLVAKDGVDNAITETVEAATWGVEEADAHNKAEASLATQLALAYAIHKSFIFLRVPLTAAVTPKVVKVLRSWGWQIGKKPAGR